MEKGIEHGWTLHEPPVATETGLLVLRLMVEGLRVEISSDGCLANFRDDVGQIRLTYDGLVAWDATGAELSARACQWEAA